MLCHRFEHCLRQFMRFEQMPEVQDRRLVRDRIACSLRSLESSSRPSVWSDILRRSSVVPKALPARTVAQLIELARSRPDGLFYASAGNGTSGHLAGELLKTRTGANLTHVPYKEGGMALTDLISGRVEFMFYHPAAVMPHIQKDTLRAIGVSGARRSVAAPEVPTLIEQGIEDFDLLPGLLSTRPPRHRRQSSRACATAWIASSAIPILPASCRGKGRDFAVEWRSGECVRKERGCQIFISRTYQAPGPNKTMWVADRVRVSSCRETTTRRSCREPDVQEAAGASACPISAEGITSAPYRLAPEECRGLLARLLDVQDAVQMTVRTMQWCHIHRRAGFADGRRRALDPRLRKY